MRQLTRLLRYAVPYWWQVLLSVILMAAVGFLDAFRLLLIGPILDRVLNPGTPTHEMKLLPIPGTQHSIHLEQFVPSSFQNPWAIVAFALISSTLIKGIFDYAGTYLVSYAGFGMITDLRDDMYNAILRRSAAFFQKHTTGTLLSTLINDLERVQFSMSSVLGEFLQQFFTLIFTVAAVVLLGGKLAWVLLLFLPVIIFSSSKIGGRVRRTTRRGQDKLAEIQNILHETITGNRIVKAFGMETWEVARFRNAAKRLLRANLRSVAAAALSSPLMDTFGAIAIALLLLLGRNEIRHGSFTPGTYLAFIALVFKLYDPVRKFALFNNSFQQAVGASSEIFRFIDSEDDVREKPGAKPLPAFSKDIVFEGVTFSYGTEGDGNRDILRRINLEVKAGEVLAIVGSSGAGKSTLVHLIPRFFDVTAGRLLVDGHDVRDVTIASLRAQIGIVTQETVLFNDTVRNNIAYGQPTRREERSGGCRQSGAGPRLHHGDARRLRNRHRRTRPAAFGRRAPAHRHCARHPEKCSHPDSGRSDFGTRQRVGSAGSIGIAEPDRGTHGIRDRAPIVDRAPRRSHRGARKRGDQRHRRARRPDEEAGHVSPPVRFAVFAGRSAQGSAGRRLKR